MEVLRPALRHGIAVEDILHAINHAITVDEVGDDPVRWLVLGPDHPETCRGLVVMDRPAGPAVIAPCRCEPDTGGCSRKPEENDLDRAPARRWPVQRSDAAHASPCVVALLAV